MSDKDSGEPPHDSDERGPTREAPPTAAEEAAGPEAEAAKREDDAAGPEPEAAKREDNAAGPEAEAAEREGNAASSGADVDSDRGEPPSDDDRAATDDTEAPPSLAHSLLHQAIVTDDQPGRRWAYPNWWKVIVSAFILFHGAVLLIHNLPGKGLSKGVHKTFNKKLQASKYMRATGNTQSWAMFAPNPHRSNIFMKVLVKDKNGEIWDLKHDIHNKRSYPYLWYDRMGKINRRIVDQKGYRRHYAAWVCRQWEKEHGGEAPEEVQFIKMWTRIPNPRKIITEAKGNIFMMGYDPGALHLYQREEDEIRCKTTRHAQLPNYLRERYGLEQAPERHFKGLHIRTWWDQKEAKAKKQEREAKRSKTHGRVK